MSSAVFIVIILNDSLGQTVTLHTTGVLVITSQCRKPVPQKEKKENNDAIFLQFQLCIQRLKDPLNVNTASLFRDTENDFSTKKEQNHVCFTLKFKVV